MANAAFFDTIDFALSPACSTIDDPNGAIIIGKDLSIDGPTSALAVSGMNESQLFDVASGVIVNISNLTIEHGTASDGGGINNSGVLTVTNSTLSGNSIAWCGSGPCGNGSGIYTSSPANLEATIMANNKNVAMQNFGQECYGSIVDSGYNIDDDGSCGFTSPSISDYAALDTTLGPLANNGDPTQTIALLPASPAIDYVPAADCPATDQRGLARRVPCDIGAFDTDGFTVTTSSLPNGAPKVVYSATLTATGGNPQLKWSVSSGIPPRGLHLNKSQGVISGWPNRKDAGTYTFTVKVVDHRTQKTRGHRATQNSATKVLSITIS